MEKKLINLCYSFEGCSASKNSCRYFESGEAAFADILENCKKAKQFIYLEFFKIVEGRLLEEVLTVLAAKAAQKVDIRILYDELGKCALKKSTLKRIKAMGIQIADFKRARRHFDLDVLFRDHRKIVVIDGEIAYTGGFNLADEYVNYISPHGRWKDAGVRLRGEGAAAFAAMFLQFWEALKGGRESEGLRLMTKEAALSDANFESINTLVLSEQPNRSESAGRAFFGELINSAKKYIYIMMPYFVLDDFMSETLKNAARSGVRVKIIIPANSDKKAVFPLSQYFAGEIAAEGAKIYQYSPGFVHSKILLTESQVYIGSFNMEYRSYFRQNECGIISDDAQLLAEVATDYRNTIKVCEQIQGIPKWGAPKGLQAGANSLRDINSAKIKRILSKAYVKFLKSFKQLI